MAPRPRHLLLFDLLTALLGDTREPPRMLFPYSWPSRRGNAALVLFGLMRLAAAPLSRGYHAIIVAAGPSLLSGEVVVFDAGVASRALRCLAGRVPFFVIAARSQAPVAWACQRLDTDQSTELHAYMSLNSVLIMFATRAGRQVVLHIAATSNGVEALARHRAGLLTAALAGLPEAARALVPEFLGERNQHGFQVLMQSRRPGAPRHYGCNADGGFQRAVDAALAALRPWRGTAKSAAGGADADLLFRYFPQSLAGDRALGALLAPVLAHCQAWQRRRALPAMLTHGDYWLLNILFDDAGAVTGVVDWERARTAGTPGLDALHLVLMSVAMACGRDIVNYVADIWLRRPADAFVAARIADIRDEFALGDADIDCLAGILLLDELHKLHSAGRAIPPVRRERFLTLEPAINAFCTTPN